MEKMKRIMFYGIEDIRIEEVDVPTPKKGEVVIKNEVTLTCGTDVKTFFRGYKWDPPFSMGHEASGKVYAVGEGVTKFKVGDRVVAHNSAPCHECYYCKRGDYSVCENPVFNNMKNGAYAQYQLIDERVVRQNMFLIPEDMSYKQAALLEPFACAVYGASQVPVKQGDYCVVTGCGPIGLMFIRLMYLSGARVIAVDKSEKRLALAQKLGAMHTVNFSKVDQIEAVKSLTPDSRGMDIAIEAVGLPEAWKQTLQMLRPAGFVMFFGGTKRGTTVEFDAGQIHYSQLTMKGVFHTTPECVNAAFELLKMKAINSDDFVQNEYDIDHVKDALIDHSKGEVIKNFITY